MFQVDFPYPWQPSIVPVQLLKVGQLVITSLPGEFTTMAGRRVRDAVAKVRDRVIEIIFAYRYIIRFDIAFISDFSTAVIFFSKNR